jgi:DNA-binding phage protein
MFQRFLEVLEELVTLALLRVTFMGLGRSFQRSVAERVREDRVFRLALLREGIEALLAGEVEAGKSVLRNYIHAAIGFGALAEATGIPQKSLLRMFGSSGNPQAKNLFLVLRYLQNVEKVLLQVRPVKKDLIQAQKIVHVGWPDEIRTP